MKIFRAALVLFLPALIVPAAPGFGQPAIPEALEPWRDWVLFGQEFRACPVFNGRNAGQAASHVCAWPGELAIEVEPDGARFEQGWTLYKEEWIPLPGDDRYWPGSVLIDGEPRAAVLRGNRPTVRVPAGEHSVTGELGWETRPASIPVPTETGLVALTLDGTAVPLPELERGTLWLGLRPEAVVEEDRLSVEVYRRLSDSIPIRLETRVQLDVAGQSREVELVGAQLPGFVGESLSSPLPAELDADGTLRLQVRPGRWTATLVAHHPDIVTELSRPELAAPWPGDEIWSFASDPALRVAVLEGAPAVDSQRAGVPGQWQALPSFVVDPDTTLNLVERSRNDTDDDNTLALGRYLWLDFDGAGFTAEDRVQGQLRSEWRLDMALPYTMTMASMNGDYLLVTAGEAPGTQGVELRTTALDLTATARLPAATSLPVTGYTDDFDRAQLVLFLPPAHRLVAAPGADQAVGAWVERWLLLDIFLALIIAVASWRLLGAVGGGIALATLVLTYHEPWAPHYAWLNLLLIAALLRVVPAGRIRDWCRRYRYLSLAALALLLVPFVAMQLRVVIFPQLEQVRVERGLDVTAGAEPPIVVTGTRVRRDDFSAPNAADVVTAEDMRQRQGELRQPQAAQAEVELDNIPGALTGRLETADGAQPTYSDNAMAGIVNTILDDASVSRYRPGALVQTGPGLPDWGWTRYSLGFDGPIDPGQEYSLIIFGPWLVGLWRVAGVALALAFGWLLLRPERGRGRPGSGSVAAAGSGGIAAAVGAIALALPAVGAAQSAEGFPSPQLLEELRTRLTEPAPCHPACAELTDARVEVGDDAIAIELELALQDSVAVPIPGSAQGWRPASIDVDGTARSRLLRDGGGQAWIRLDAGVRELVLSGPVPAADSLALPFPLMPRRIAVEAPGWDVAGVTDGRLPSGTLELIRQRETGEDGDDTIQATAFPPYVRVTRALRFGIDWTATTVVQRIAPRDGAFTIDVDLLPDEAVVTEDIEVADGAATLAFAADQNALSWQSRLPAGESLGITAADDAPWTETWQFDAGHEWHAEYAGLPATRTLGQGQDRLIVEYLPRPGETLDIELTQPEPVTGDTIAIDDLRYRRTVGDRSAEAGIEFSYRSTRATEHPIRLPADSELQSVTIDGRNVPLELDGNTLTLPVTPGEHRIRVDWRGLEGVGLNAGMAPIDLGAGTSNITLTLALPADRWTLAAYGPTLGPAVLYWAELAVFVLAAIILGRLPPSPLKTHEWLLLGLGLSTFSWPVLLLFAVWAFVMSWRGRNRIGGPRYAFNAAQIGLGLLTLVTLAALIGSIANGLLGTPNMHIVSPVQDGTLSWFTDRSDGVTPAAGAISVSLWFYKAAMLAWALWLSFALLRWLRFAWTAFSAEGLWRGKVAASGGA